MADDGHEVTADELFDTIINKPPMESNHYHISLEDAESVDDIFAFCMEFFQKICIRYWGDANNKVDVTKLTTAELDTIKRYFNSVGLEFSARVLEYTSPDFNFYNRRHYNKADGLRYEQLADIYYILRPSGVSHVYVISFDFINNRS
jgi:hypothetical protein